MKLTILALVSALLFTSCSGENDVGVTGKSLPTRLNAENAHDAGDLYTAEDVDDMIGDWIDINEEKPAPLPQWYADRETRVIEWLKREEAIRVFNEVKKQFGVELNGLASEELPDYTTSIVGPLSRDTDLAGLKAYLLAVSSDFQLSVRFGERWIMFDGVLDENGEFVPK